MLRFESWVQPLRARLEPDAPIQNDLGLALRTYPKIIVRCGAPLSLTVKSAFWKCFSLAGAAR